MTKDTNKIKYFAYLRKSSEDKEKQALSIPAQKDKLTEMFKGLDIEFVDEEKSAFIPYNRPKFAEMLERIRSGERQGLLAWHPDRLSRNEVDASSITYMLRTGHIKDLKLATYHFENDSPEGIWMLQMALSQSQYESAKKGRDVKRGLEAKAKMGVRPVPPNIGYMGDKLAEKGNKTTLVDLERFDLVRKMFDLMLTGKYSPPQIVKIATDEWGLRTRKGKKISRSNIYLLFSNTFYYGEYEYPVGTGKWYQGTHKPMITREEYDRIQYLLGKRGRPRPKSHDIAYRGPIKCGECGAMITAEEKTKHQKNGNVHHYTYYHCTKKKDPNCSQGAIEEKELEKQIARELKKLEIPADFKDWALARLKTMHAQEISDREKMYGNQKRSYEASVRKLDNLIDMRANGEITEEEFRNRKQDLLTEKGRQQELLKDTDHRIENWLEVAERGFNFAEKASSAFAKATEENNVEVKKDIFIALGSDLILKDQELVISWDNLLFPIKNVAEKAREISARLEPRKNVDTKGYFGKNYAKSPVLLPG